MKRAELSGKLQGSSGKRCGSSEQAGAAKGSLPLAAYGLPLCIEAMP